LISIESIVLLRAYDTKLKVFFILKIQYFEVIKCGSGNQIPIENKKF